VHGAIAGAEVPFDKRAQFGEVFRNFVMNAATGVVVPVAGLVLAVDVSGDAEAVVSVPAIVIITDVSGDPVFLAVLGENFRTVLVALALG
jgi:hypothetical protein